MYNIYTYIKIYFSMDEIDITHQLLREHILSDEVNIYTITSILIKNYNEAPEYKYQLITCLMCFIVQISVPILVIYDILTDLLEDDYSIGGVCSGNGTSVDKSCATIMCLFLIFFYIHRWRIYITQINKEDSSIILLKNMELFVSEIFFNFGFIANILVHCMNTIVGLLILYYTTGALDIVINCCVMYYFNDISNFFVTKNLKDQCNVLLEKKYNSLSKDINISISELNRENITYRKWFDTYIGIFSFIFMVLVFPILGISILLALFGGLIFIPLCRP